MLAGASMAALVGSHSLSPFEPWFSPFLPHATILVLLVLIGHLVGRHWRSSAVLAVAGVVGVWSWTNALQLQTGISKSNTLLECIERVCCVCESDI